MSLPVLAPLSSQPPIAPRASALASSVLGALLPLLLGLLAITGCHDDAPTAPDSGTAAEATPAAATASVVAAAFAQVASDGFSSCAVSTDSRAYCWGDNALGELGDGTTTGHLVPQPVAGDLRFRLVANNSHRACAITTDNRVYCWGDAAVGDGLISDQHFTLPGSPSPWSFSSRPRPRLPGAPILDQATRTDARSGNRSCVSCSTRLVP